MRKLICGVSLIGAVSASAVLFSGAAQAAPDTPCLTVGSTLADCVSVLPIAGSGTGSSGDSFELFDSGWLGLPPYIDEEITFVPEKENKPKQPIQLQPE